MVVSNFKANKVLAFSRDKLFLSIYKSCGHRQDAISCAAALVDTVIQHLLTKDTKNPAVVSKSDIINITKTILNRFDKVAAIAYGAYHQLPPA
jgi:transcriptional regulator NrdR family protein